MSTNHALKTAGDLENRNDVRARLNLRVFYGSSLDVMATAYMVNLGHGGVFIRTESPFDIGHILDLEFTLPDSFRSISAQAKVAWTRLNDEGDLFPAGMGLMFTRISPNDQVALNDYIRKLAKQHAL